MYNGHVFWDQETWMYPPIQLLHGKIGKAIIKTRTRTLDNAKHQAMMRGYNGAMYPWESAFSGTKVFKNCRLPYIYIYNYVISISLFQFQDMTSHQFLLISNLKNI